MVIFPQGEGNEGNMRFKTGATLLISAGMLATSAVVAVPASADPICAKGMKDQGVTRTTNFPKGNVHSGTYFNCSGGTGADKRKIRVDFGMDSGCITVPYGSMRSTEAHGTDVSRNPRWVSC